MVRASYSYGIMDILGGLWPIVIQWPQQTDHAGWAFYCNQHYNRPEILRYVHCPWWPLGQQTSVNSYIFVDISC